MIKGRTVCAVITARGGSKGVPGKNVKLLHGKPLIAWTIEAAKTSKYVDRIIVTTDSAQIADVSRQFGAEAPFLRPPELAEDFSKQEDALLHAMRWIEANDRKYDLLVILVPTTPIRNAQDLDEVLAKFVENPEARAMVTVTECEHSPLTMNRLPESLSMADFVPEEIKLKNRQELPTYYQISGSVCIIEWDYFIEQGTVLTQKTFAHIVDFASGLDINGPIDFKMAELLLAERLSGTDRP